MRMQHDELLRLTSRRQAPLVPGNETCLPSATAVPVPRSGGRSGVQSMLLLGASHEKPASLSDTCPRQYSCMKFRVLLAPTLRLSDAPRYRAARPSFPRRLREAEARYTKMKATGIRLLRPSPGQRVRLSGACCSIRINAAARCTRRDRQCVARIRPSRCGYYDFSEVRARAAGRPEFIAPLICQRDPARVPTTRYFQLRGLAEHVAPRVPMPS